MPQGIGTYGSQVGRPPKTAAYQKDTDFDFKSEKPKNIKGWKTDKYGERDFSPHNISARKTEGTIKQQKERRDPTVDRKSPNKDTGYTPYKMKGSPMKRNFGVGDTPKGTSDTESPSPNKGWFKKMAKKVGGFVKGGGLVGMAAKKLAGTGDLEKRVAALEESAAGGGGVEAEADAAAGAAGDPAAAAAAEGGDPAAAGLAAKGAHLFKNPTKGMGVAGSMAGSAASIFSDIRLKEKIQKTGVSSSGIPIYEFNYIGDTNRYSGAMAQDLLEMNIGAVSMDASGYYKVNYNNIDVDMHLIN